VTAKSKTLHDVFGFESFRPGQEEIVDDLLSGRHVLAVMPTGSGKSLCYQVPALVLGGLTIVVSPLVALMQDQVAALKLAGVAAETINSAASRETNVAIWQRVASGDVHILYLAPERLMTERMIAALQRLDVRLIAVDEAHCISQWGASFRPEYEALHNLRAAFPDVPIGAFTATADEAARRDIVQRLFGGQAQVHVSGFDRPNISLTVEAKVNTGKQLLAFLDGRQGQSGIVYALSRKSCEDWAVHLSGHGYKAIAYHAGMSPEKRSDAQERFMAEAGVIVCATIAFGMGIDKPDVRFVFHADLPSSLDAYYQEIGRAGRDGQVAAAHMAFGMGDIRLRRNFIAESDADDGHKRRENRRLDALVNYCQSPSCRRMALLSYFGEDSQPCGNCDVCLDPGELLDGTNDARLALEVARMTGERFGAGHLTDVLIGKVTEKTESFGHGKSLLFGKGRHRAKSEWQSLIRQIAASGLLALDAGGFGGLVLTERGRALLNSDGNFRYRREVVRITKKSQRAEAMAAASADPVTEALLTRLKDLRRKLAAARGVPAYVVFSDRSLIDMAKRVPLTRHDFSEVHGVGEAKLKEFGDLFLNEIAESFASAASP
jgi:ATP-dependent DNA helicase RecQ